MSPESKEFARLFIWYVIAFLIVMAVIVACLRPLFQGR